MKKIAMILVVAGMLAACNTMEGLGKDIKQAGESIQQKAAK